MTILVGCRSNDRVAHDRISAGRHAGQHPVISAPGERIAVGKLLRAPNRQLVLTAPRTMLTTCQRLGFGRSRHRPTLACCLTRALVSRYEQDRQYRRKARSSRPFSCSTVGRPPYRCPVRASIGRRGTRRRMTFTELALAEEDPDRAIRGAAATVTARRMRSADAAHEAVAHRVRRR